MGGGGPSGIWRLGPLGWVVLGFAMFVVFPPIFALVLESAVTAEYGKPLAWAFLVIPMIWLFAFTWGLPVRVELTPTELRSRTVLGVELVIRRDEAIEAPFRDGIDIVTIRRRGASLRDFGPFMFVTTLYDGPTHFASALSVWAAPTRAE